MSLLPPFFVNAVVAIGNIDSSGNERWVASGFLYGAKQAIPKGGWGEGEQEYSLWLITNRHVSTELENAMIRFDSSSAGPAIKVKLIEVAAVETWTSHTNNEIDVSVIQLDVSSMRRFTSTFSFYQEEESAATLAKLQALGVHEGNGGFILGFPLGLVEGATGSVIVRKSTIARIRNSYEHNSPIILIDGNIFPGNSGGPAVIHPEPIVIEGTSPIQNAYLIGVVAGYHTFNDVAVNPQTGEPRIVFRENAGLGIVYTVDCIQETIVMAQSLGKA